MSLFRLFKTNPNLEREGVLLEYGENSKGKPIGIRIARAGGANVQFQKRLDVLVKPYRRQIQTETIDSKQIEKLMRQVYAETVVLGWENVEDENGDELTFSVDNCVRLFDALPDLFSDIQEQAGKAALFRAELLEAEAKN